MTKNIYLETLKSVLGRSILHYFRQTITRDETPHKPQSFRPKTFRPFKYDNQEQQQQPGLCFGCEKRVTTRTNIDLTKQHKDKDITDKRIYSCAIVAA